jgi:predicted transcriptional regulator
MNIALKAMLPTIEKWPAEDQEALADYAREIEALRSGMYTMTPEEDAAVQEGIDDADRGELVSAQSIAALTKLYKA